MNQKQLAMIVLVVVLAVVMATAPVNAVAYTYHYSIPTHKTNVSPFPSGEMKQGTIPYHLNIPNRHK